MAWCSLFVLKVPLNSNQPINQPLLCVYNQSGTKSAYTTVSHIVVECVCELLKPLLTSKSEISWAQQDHHQQHFCSTADPLTILLTASLLLVSTILLTASLLLVSTILLTASLLLVSTILLTASLLLVSTILLTASLLLVSTILLTASATGLDVPVCLAWLQVVAPATHH